MPTAAAHLAGAPTPIPAAKFEAPSTQVTASRCSGASRPPPCALTGTTLLGSPDAASGPLSCRAPWALQT